MALPLLVNGAQCGPSNPLQALTKHVDRNRGIQQDFFGTNNAGPSKQIFRSQTAQLSAQDQESASQFFRAANSTGPLVQSSPFDLSALDTSLHPIEAALKNPPLLAEGWAADFAAQSNASSSTGKYIADTPHVKSSYPLHETRRPQLYPASYRIGQPIQLTAPTTSHIPTHAKPPAVNWDKEFDAWQIDAEATVVSTPQELAQDPRNIDDGDELSRTAGLLLQSVKNEQNPKFQNSTFLGLMKQIRDREVVIQGDKMMENHDVPSQTDVKGKGRSVDFSSSTVGQGSVSSIGRQTYTRLADGSDVAEVIDVGEEDAYWRRENEEYMKFWDCVQNTRPPAGEMFWGDNLQEDWDRFEATTAGIRALPNYQFQDRNPYLRPESSTKHHQLHTTGRNFLLESVLELEAQVQLNMTDASAWFELGVKQQENEREQKAIQALERAAILDPTHLPTWQALAISYTNDANRNGSYEAIRQWVHRNPKYESLVKQYSTRHPEKPSASSAERFAHLTECLLALARKESATEIDPDVQIALAVLFNTNEDYAKAQDCFRAALSVRPEDWSLYNRVGATMANSGHPEEAVEYYYRALQLNPLHIRARYNLGISCINLRRHHEAAQHILDALVLQDSDRIQDATGLNEKRGVISSALWDSLKTACLNMQRADLATLCDKQDLETFRIKFQTDTGLPTP